MVKYYLISVFLLTWNLSFSQDYSSANSNKSYIFEASDSSHFVGMRFTQITFLGQDSVFHPQLSLRDDTGNCDVKISASWAGFPFSIDANGVHKFVNSEYDTIYLHTHDALGDTSIIYTYPDNSWVKSVVDDVSYESVLGVMDSIKTFKLLSNNIGFELKGDIRISKNHGAIETFSWFSFPNPYPQQSYWASPVNGPLYDSTYVIRGIKNLNTNSYTGIQMPTSNSVYDYNIGDIQFHAAYDSHFTSGSGESIKENHEILNKQITSTDLIFTVDRYGINEYWPYPTQYYHDTVTITHADPDANVLQNEIGVSAMPEEFRSSSSYLNVVELKRVNFCYQTGLSSTVHNLHLFPNSYGCFDYPFEITIETTSFTEGFGKRHYRFSPSDNGNMSSGMYAYKSTSDSCGNFVYLNIDENPDRNLNLRLYPNPNSGSFVIDGLEPGDQVEITISDLTGRIVYSDRYVPGSSINIEEANGLYLINVNVNDHYQLSCKLQLINN